MFIHERKKEITLKSKVYLQMLFLFFTFAFRHVSYRGQQTNLKKHFPQIFLKGLTFNLLWYSDFFKPFPLTEARVQTVHTE